jgi:hypothetical protein
MERLRRNMKYISRRQAVSWLGFELRSSLPRSRHAARCIAVFGDYWWAVKLLATTRWRIEVQRVTGHGIVKQVPSISYPNFRRNRWSWFPKVPVFRHVTPCRPIQVCSSFRGTCCLNHPCGSSTVQRRHTFTKLYGVISQTRYLLVNAINFKLHLIPGVHKFPRNIEATSKLQASERRRQVQTYKI